METRAESCPRCGSPDPAMCLLPGTPECPDPFHEPVPEPPASRCPQCQNPIPWSCTCDPGERNEENTTERLPQGDQVADSGGAAGAGEQDRVGQEGRWTISGCPDHGPIISPVRAGVYRCDIAGCSKRLTAIEVIPLSLLSDLASELEEAAKRATELARTQKRSYGSHPTPAYNEGLARGRRHAASLLRDSIGRS